MSHVEKTRRLLESTFPKLFFNSVFQLLSDLSLLRKSKFPSRKSTLLNSDIFGYFLFIEL